MTTNVCPAANVAASVEQVWAVMTDLAQFDTWWDAQTEHIEPAGPIQPGQTVYARTRALGRWWPVSTTVEMVEASRHRLRLRTTLPLGITVHNQIACTALDQGSCRVQFG